MLKLKAEFLQKKVTIGSWITLGYPSLAEIMAKAGFDWLVIDMEHSAITLRECQQLIQIIELLGVVPLVRVGENNSNHIKRVMDAGAHGVIVPMVNTVEDAINAVNAVKYPPLGKRGVGLARAQGYGFAFGPYRDWVNKESIVIVQIEHIKALDNLRDILKVNGVDGILVGPYDLTASLGIPGEFKNKNFRNSLKKIIRVSQEMKKPAGFHIISPDRKELLKKIREGYKFLGFSLDTLFLGTKINEELKGIRKSRLNILGR